MKKKGFTLIELLAVIVILAVIALISIPVIMNLIDKSRKNAFKDSVYALASAAENYVAYEEAQGNTVDWSTNSITKEEYLSFNLSNENDVKKLNVKGKVPSKGRVEIAKGGQTYVVAIEKNMCAKKEYNERVVNLLSLNSDNICLLTSQTGGLDSEETTDLISTVTKLATDVKKLQEDNKEIAVLKEQMNSIKNETIDNIYPVGSIYISTDIKTVEGVKEKFGGTWVRYGQGKTLVGVDESQEDYKTAEKTGGSDSVSLTTANLPEHNHSFTPSGTVSKPTFTGSAVTSGDNSANPSASFKGTAGTTGNQSANHTHSIPSLSGTASGGNHRHTNPSNVYNGGGTGYSSIYVGSGSSIFYYNGTYYSNYSGDLSLSVSTNSSTTGNQSANHNHSFTPSGTVSLSGSHTHSVTAAGSVSQPTFTGTAGSTGNSGSNTAFSVMNPYVTVYMYKRTA